MQFKKILSQNEKKRKKDNKQTNKQKNPAETHQVCFFPTSICDSIEHQVRKDKAERMRENASSLHGRSFIKAGRSVRLVTTESLTVSSIRSSCFRTGVPDWHNNNSKSKISVTCDDHTRTQPHAPIPAPVYSANTCEHKSRQASA